jgi:hypothetical protein
MHAFGVEDVYLCVVQSYENVVISQMQTRYDALIRGELVLIQLATRTPRRFDLIALLEVATVG